MKRLFANDDLADANTIGTLLMIGVVVAAVPGLMAIQSGIRASYDAGTEQAKVAAENARAAVPANDPEIDAANTLTVQLIMQAAEAQAAAASAGAAIVNHAATIADLQAEVATKRQAETCADAYTAGLPLPPGCQPDPKAWQAYSYWYSDDGAWICKTYGIQNQKQCYVKT